MKDTSIPLGRSLPSGSDTRLLDRLTSVPRNLKSHEVNVLRMMIEQGAASPLREQLLAQIPDLQAWNTCGCGTCPSISLGDHESEYEDLPGSVVIEAWTEGAGLVLFIDGVRPTYLELYPIAEGRIFTEFPPVADIVVQQSITE